MFTHPPHLDPTVIDRQQWVTCLRVTFVSSGPMTMAGRAKVTS